MDLPQFGAQLRALRQQAGWSQEELVEVLDQLGRLGSTDDYRVIDGNLLSRWERAHTQKGRTWKPTRTYTLYLIQLFAPYLDLVSAQAWAAQAGHAIQIVELQAWFSVPTAGDNGVEESAENDVETSTQPKRAVMPIHHLPALATPLLGRAAEQAQIRDLLIDQAHQLITLFGPGGVGKTALAIQTVTELFAHFPDGVRFIDLSVVRDPDLVVATIAQLLDTSGLDTAPPLAQLKEAWSEQRRLLLLDNFEQVSAAAGRIAELLAACPRLTILVTSRTILHLRSEHLFSVSPLALPPLSPLPPVAQLAEFSAVALFIRCGQAAVADFQLNLDNAHAIAELCYRLDGLPLGIELAASRLKLFSPQTLLAYLQSQELDGSADRRGPRLSQLTEGGGDVPLRHRTLWNLIDWSYNLLDLPAQQLFIRLAIFVNGFTTQAVEAICGGREKELAIGPSAPNPPAPNPPAPNATPNADVSTVSVFSSLVTLLEHSLIRQRLYKNDPKGGPADGTPRYSMLEMIREYSWERFTAAPECALIQERHALYYLSLAEQVASHLRDADPTPWLDQLEAEYDNLRRALVWSLIETQQVEIGLRLTSALSLYWYRRGDWNEGRTWLERALAQTKQASASPTRGRVLLSLGEVFWGQGDYKFARTACEEALICFRTLQDQDGVASTVSVLGLVAREQGDSARARTLIEESLVLFRQQGNLIATSWALCSLGEVAVIDEDTAQATTIIGESLAIFHQNGDQLGTAWAYNHLGHVAQLRGEYQRARALHKANLAYFRNNDRNGTAWTLNGLASVALDLNDYQGATTDYLKSLALFQELESKQGIAWSLAGLGSAAAGHNQAERAVRLWGAAETLRNAIGSRPAPAIRVRDKQALAAQQSRLGAKDFEQVWNEGQMMLLTQAVSYATSVD